jgi:hypothetical protein
MVTTTRCSNCYSWEELEDHQRGRCRRHAPTPSLSGLEALWPITRADDWCGQFEPISAVSMKKRGKAA